MMSLCYAAVLLFNAPDSAPGLSEGMAVELKALEARQALRNGVVELSVEYLKEDGGPPSVQGDPTPTVDLKITFDGHRRFVETRFQGHTRTEQRMFDGTKYFVDDGGSAERIIIDSRGLAGSRYLLFNPRLLGVYPLMFHALASNHNSLDEVLVRTDRTDEQVHVEQLSNQEVIHVFHKHLAGRVHESVWIAPKLNHSVVKMEITVPSANTRSELLSEYDKPFGDVWFPRRTMLRTYRLPDNLLTMEEVVTVKSAAFNQGIDASLFTLSAFQPKVGDLVREDGAPMAWNGNKLVPAHDGATVISKSGGVLRSWTWFAVAVLLAIAAFAILRRSFART